MLGDFQPIPFIEGLLKTLLVYCPNQERGCVWTGERGNQDNHVDRYCKHADPRDDQHAAEAAVHVAQQALDLDALCDSLNPAAINVVALDVSGVLFKASRATLAKYPLSALGAMFAGRRKLQLLDDGRVFLNAPAETFGRVLSWLQEGVVPTDLSSYDAELLFQHAKKWRFDELVVALGEGRSEVQGSLRFSQAKLVSCMQVADTSNGGCLSLPGANLSGLYLGGARLEKIGRAHV